MSQDVRRNDKMPRTAYDVRRSEKTKIMTATQQLHAAEAAYNAALTAKNAARDAGELAACQRLLPLLKPEHLAALAKNAVAWNIPTTDVSAIGVLCDPDRCINGLAEKLLAPVWRKYNELLKEEQLTSGLPAMEAALKKAQSTMAAARALPENIAAEKAAAEARAAAQYSPHIGGGFADDEMYLH
jgi:hypothetical protein